MSELVALLDLGSNAARFLLARLQPGVGFRILEQERVPTRLGSGPDGVLTDAAVRATSRAAERFLQRVRTKQGPRVLAVATAAVRDAPNRERLIERLRERGGVELRILSGSEEARLGAEAAVRELPLLEGSVVDIGGGSAQVTLVRRGRLGIGISMPLGAARLTRRHLQHDPPTALELAALRDEVFAHLSGHLKRGFCNGQMVLLGGTGRALARRKLRTGPDRPSKRRASKLTLVELQRLRARLEKLTSRQRASLRGLKPERADIVVAGAIVLEELMLYAGCNALTVCSASVREGVLLREAKRLPR
jgi:exopolyphosphatase / guanosine-5'-triphosphate,3'-diphosphate pyrophosphatase